MDEEDAAPIGLNFASPEDKESLDADESGEAFVRSLRRMIGTITANSTYHEQDLWSMTLPQVEMRYEDVIRYRIGFHGMIGDEDMNRKKPEREHTVEEGFAFAALFNGIGG